jgi:hypothetical protein
MAVTKEMMREFETIGSDTLRDMLYVWNQDKDQDRGPDLVMRRFLEEEPAKFIAQMGKLELEYRPRKKAEDKKPEDSPAKKDIGADKAIALIDKLLVEYAERKK